MTGGGPVPEPDSRAGDAAASAMGAIVVETSAAPMQGRPADPPRPVICKRPDGRMHALDYGPAGRPYEIVFLHGNGFHGAVHADLVAPLARRARTLLPDLRGFGASELPADPARLRDWSALRDDVIGLLDACNVRGAVLGGHSLGAALALQVAAARPDLARAVVMTEPVLLPPWVIAATRFALVRRAMTRRLPIARASARRRVKFASRREAFDGYVGRGPFKTWEAEDVRAYVDHAFRDAEGGVELACAPAWEAAIYAAQSLSPWAALRRLERPLIVLAGGAGSTAPAWAEARVRRLLPGVRWERYPDATHFLPMERKDAVRAALLDALALGGRPKPSLRAVM